MFSLCAIGGLVARPRRASCPREVGEQEAQGAGARVQLWVLLVLLGTRDVRSLVGPNVYELNI